MHRIWWRRRIDELIRCMRTLKNPCAAGYLDRDDVRHCRRDGETVSIENGLYRYSRYVRTYWLFVGTDVVTVLSSLSRSYRFYLAAIALDSALVLQRGRL